MQDILVMKLPFQQITIESHNCYLKSWIPTLEYAPASSASPRMGNIVRIEFSIPDQVFKLVRFSTYQASNHSESWQSIIEVLSQDKKGSNNRKYAEGQLTEMSFP